MAHVRLESDVFFWGGGGGLQRHNGRNVPNAWEKRLFNSGLTFWELRVLL